MTYRSLYLATAVAVGSCLSQDFARAQVDIPFQVTSGVGTLDQFPDGSNPTPMHNITTGTAEFGGQSLNYTMPTAAFEVLGPPDASGTLPFHSASPGFFDFGNGDTLLLHYGRTDFGAPTTGFATITPDGNLNDVIFLATFNPVPGSGTGIFENVVGGDFFMTAMMDNVDLAGTDIPYSWSSDVGKLTLVPEPCVFAIVGTGVAGLVVIGRRRRR